MAAAANAAERRLRMNAPFPDPMAHETITASIRQLGELPIVLSAAPVDRRALFVMAGLVPAIHVLRSIKRPQVSSKNGTLFFKSCRRGRDANSSLMRRDVDGR